ncbi:hypothetical protein FNL39_108176 [Nocardia caishijiensis]|uniref:6-phosphogluconolactonase (Cycloisomerase 2 family) n=2 Tax=Nocardia caishijiensis TaxID=184756 RepID=A0ABQ6YHV8_9NOCA|nr:hypothetical protein FNL39_108176 [Nocardia caishijiensis]
MHGDAGSSDVVPHAGPGIEARGVGGFPLGAACPTLLQGSDGLVVALCTAVTDRAPVVHLIDPGTGSAVSGSLAQSSPAKGGLLGGVYAYLDHADRLVMVDGNRDLLRIAHERGVHGWELRVVEAVDLTAAIPADDNVTGLVPDWSGTVWFATENGVVGTVTVGGAISTLTLPLGETVANSISSAPTGRVSVATTHALYEFGTDASGHPVQLWRAAYDRGPARKPGQLSWGTGSTPTYFGPDTGADYLTIVDNAADRVKVLVFRSGSGELLCEQAVLTEGGAGSENSPIGIGGSVFVASTYGYPYPAVPAGAGPAHPETAPFAGGMTRVDVDSGGCRTVWENTVRSAAVPHLSTEDGLIYTVTRDGTPNTTPLDGYSFTVIDPNSGAVIGRNPLPPTMIADPLQTSPLILRDGDVLQGVTTGIVRVGR